jgi:hypothetical protein
MHTGKLPTTSKPVDVHHLALVADMDDVPADLPDVAAAVQRQLTEHVAPIWGVHATISAFPSLERVPTSYWPVIVSDRYRFPQLGFHAFDPQPLALIKYTGSYSQGVSHEAIEMVVDPDGERMAAAKAPTRGPAPVQYLLEVCDPSEGHEYGYCIDGILLSDFYTPHFFEDEFRPGVPYSFTGAVKEPLQVLPGGYLTWRDPDTGDWSQNRRFGDKQDTRELTLPPGDASLRAKVDRLTRNPELEDGVPFDAQKLRDAIAAAEKGRWESRERAQRLREFIHSLQQDAPQASGT